MGFALWLSSAITGELVSDFGPRTTNPSPSTASVSWAASAFLPRHQISDHAFPSRAVARGASVLEKVITECCTVCTQWCHVCGTSLTVMGAGGWGHLGWEAALDGPYSMRLCWMCFLEIQMLKEQSSQARRCLCGFVVTPHGSGLSQHLHRLVPRDASRWDMRPGGFCLLCSFLWKGSAAASWQDCLVFRADQE